MSRYIGKFTVNTLSVTKNPNSPIYSMTIVDKTSKCFYEENPTIELNESIFTIQEISNSGGFNHVVDEYDLLITHVSQFITDPKDNFSITFEGKRLNVASSVPVIEPVIIDILVYNTALLLLVACDANKFIVDNKVNISTPEARAYFSKMQRINHLGTLYSMVPAATSYIAIKSDMPNKPEELKLIKSGLIFIYTSVEVPVQEDIEMIKRIHQRKMK